MGAIGERGGQGSVQCTRGLSTPLQWASPIAGLVPKACGHHHPNTSHQEPREQMSLQQTTPWVGTGACPPLPVPPSARVPAGSKGPVRSAHRQPEGLASALVLPMVSQSAPRQNRHKAPRKMPTAQQRPLIAPASPQRDGGEPFLSSGWVVQTQTRGRGATATERGAEGEPHNPGVPLRPRGGSPGRSSAQSSRGTS